MAIRKLVSFLSIFGLMLSAILVAKDRRLAVAKAFQPRNADRSRELEAA